MGGVLKQRTLPAGPDRLPPKRHLADHFGSSSHSNVKNPVINTVNHSQSYHKQVVYTMNGRFISGICPIYLSINFINPNGGWFYLGFVRIYERK